MRSWYKRLAAAATLCLLTAAGIAPAAARQDGTPPPADVVPFVLPAPPASVRGAGTVRVKLVKVSEKADNSTEDAGWLKRNGLALPEYTVPNAEMQVTGDLPAGLPETFEGGRLIRAFKSGATTLLLYGPDFARGRYLVGWDVKSGKIRYALDFAAYTAPNQEGGVTPMTVLFAREDIDGTLYVSTGINGYAAEARGRTAYVTALEPKSGKVKWHSAPLVANAGTFELVGDALVSGYGFTREKDYLYVLNKKTGRTAARIPLKDGPDTILRKGDRLYIRGYATNTVFAIK